MKLLLEQIKRKRTGVGRALRQHRTDQHLRTLQLTFLQCFPGLLDDRGVLAFALHKVKTTCRAVVAGLNAQRLFVIGFTGVPLAGGARTLGRCQQTIDVFGAVPD